MSDVIDALSVRQLRAYVTDRGGSTVGCVEKGDLRAAARAVASRPSMAGKTCTACGGRPTRACAACGMLLYCSAACVAADVRHAAVECHLTRTVLPRSACEGPALVAALPWAARLLADDHAAGACGRSLAAALAAAGGGPDGFWRRDAGRGRGVPFGALPPPPPSPAGAAWGGLPAAAVPPSTPLAAPLAGPLGSWGDYLAARGLPPSSVAPLLLHPALTVYAAVAAAITTADGGGGGRSGAAPSVVVHLLGVEAELDALPLLAEVSHLLPDTRLHLVAVAPAVPADRDGEVVALTPTATVTLVRGLYHEYAMRGAWEPPAVVVALNAGLCAYPEWLPTLQLVASRRLTLVATDYIQYSVELPRIKFPMLGVAGTWSAAELNPFRQPAARCGHNSDLFPNYSNGFRVVFRGGG